ncbi:hypothetical protein ACEZCY_15355 [Streptacidiphilus sp. N1-12]|uniref:Uncharacterized protein n=2 Tax=Streptacidiphilus alkalitolerans TaxID=3342712 RepID=A0ABV6WF00_9ACTN
MILPHGPYFTAVMTALVGTADPAESWAAYDSDNGETMLMEIVIYLERERAAAAGFTRGVLLYWDQVTGWQWCSCDSTGGGSDVHGLVGGDVPTPDSVAHAAALLLDPRTRATALPAPGTETPDAPAIALNAALTAALDEDDPATVRRLAHYTRTSGPGTTPA